MTIGDCFAIVQAAYAAHFTGAADCAGIVAIGECVAVIMAAHTADTIDTADCAGIVAIGDCVAIHSTNTTHI